MIRCELWFDDREKTSRKAIKSSLLNIKQKRLAVGDFRCACGMVGIERKEKDIENMAQVLRQVEELKKAYTYPYLIITMPAKAFLRGTLQYGQRIAFISSLMVRGVTPLFLPSSEDMLEIVQYLIIKHHDGKVRNITNFPSVRHIKNKDLQINVLTSLPGVIHNMCQTSCAFSLLSFNCGNFGLSW